MEKIDRKRYETPWLVATLGVAFFYSALALRLAFRSPNLVQDDARQHVFWMQRYVDPSLFPNDLIADYFQSVAPAGYKAIYWIFAKVGVEPLLLSKILPGLIGVLTAWIAFRLFIRLTNDARGAFFAAVIIAQLAWFKDDVISGTPRAFAWPLLLGFLLFLTERRVIPCLLLLALQGLIYPQVALVSLVVLLLRLFNWNRGIGAFGEKRSLFSRERHDYILAFAGIAIIALVLAVFASSASHFGPAIDRIEAGTLPEFFRHGRSQFFGRGIRFHIGNPRGGIWPGSIPAYLCTLGVAGFVFLVAGRNIIVLERFRSRTPLLFQLALAGMVMWAGAHLLLFKLHLPARYIQGPVRLLVGLMSAAAMMSIFAAIEWSCATLRPIRPRLATAVALSIPLLSILLIGGPLLSKKFPSQTYIKGRPEDLFAFLAVQPKNVLVATLNGSASKIPVFAHRSVLVSAEHAVPYHTGYYRIIRERGKDLIDAQFTPDPDELRRFIEKYHVDLLIVPHHPVTPEDFRNMGWFRDIVPPAEIARRLGQGQQPALSAFVDRCKVWTGRRDIVLDAKLIAQTIKLNETPTSP